MKKSAEKIQNPRHGGVLTDRDVRTIARALGLPPHELLATAKLVESGRLQRAR